MQIESIAIRKIIPAPFNPRVDQQQGDPDYERIKRSLEEFGNLAPLVWNRRSGYLLGGHQRLKILIEQGATEVEVIPVDLPPDRERALCLALNRAQGSWDEEKLAHLLDELLRLPDFDLGITGFDPPEAQALIASVFDTTLETKEESFDVNKALEDESLPVTKRGELIELGRHRLFCGDSSLLEDLRRAIAKEPCDLLFTDPPYNVAYLGGERPTPEKARPKRSRPWQLIYGDNLSQEEYERWLGKVFTNIKGCLAPGSPAYIWNGHRQFGPMHQLLTGLGFKISCVITWAKPNFAIGYGDYNQQTEFALYGWLEENGAHRWFGPTNESTLWEVKRDPTKTYSHPTQKPLELAERAIRNSTQPGDTVLDTFLGSGTTLIAAERTGRKCVGLEISPLYADVIVRRYIAFVGEDKVSPELAERYRLPKEVRL